MIVYFINDSVISEPFAPARAAREFLAARRPLEPLEALRAWLRRRRV